MRLLTLVSAVVLAVVLIPENVFGSHRAPSSWQFSGCKLDPLCHDDIRKVMEYRVGGCKWDDEDVWSFLMMKWNWLRRDKADVIAKWRKYEGECANGERDRICQVCNGASSIEECIQSGEVQECQAGENACVLQYNSAGYFRHCGHLSQCQMYQRSYNAPKYIVKEHCHKAGCNAVFGCAAVGCFNDTGIFVKFRPNPPPNSAFEADGTACRCDPACVMNPDPSEKPCCSDVCQVCGMLPEYVASMMCPMNGGGGD